MKVGVSLFIPQTTWEEYAKRMDRVAALRSEAGFAPAHPTLVCCFAQEALPAVKARPVPALPGA